MWFGEKVLLLEFAFRCVPPIYRCHCAEGYRNPGELIPKITVSGWSGLTAVNLWPPKMHPKIAETAQKSDISATELTACDGKNRPCCLHRPESSAITQSRFIGLGLISQFSSVAEIPAYQGVLVFGVP